MKKNIGKYPEVKTLPSNAVTVRQYAEENNFTTSYVYKLIKNKSDKFKIVIFQEVNFIIPIKK